MPRKAFPVFLFLFFVLISGCGKGIQIPPWPIQQGGLGSAEADLGRARVHREHSEQQLRIIEERQYQDGVGKANFDLSHSISPSCYGCPPIMAAAYWRIIRQNERMIYEQDRQAEYQRGEAIGTMEINRGGW